MSTRHGAMLVEVILSLAMFAMAAMAIIAALTQGTTSVERVRDSALAVDLARTAMAEIEAGIASPGALNGPVPVWSESERAMDDPELAGVFADAPPADSGWELRIQTSPSGFPGLTHVRVTAVRLTPMGSTLASYTLHQLVRLGSREEDDIGDEDELMDAVRRGAADRDRAGRFERDDPFSRPSPLDAPGRFDPPPRGGRGSP